MPGDLVVNPPTVEVGSRGLEPLYFNLAPSLRTGEVPISPETVLVDMATGLAYPTGLVGAPTIQANVSVSDPALGTVVLPYALVQTVGNLVAEQAYRLIITFTAAAGRIETFAVYVICPF